MSMEFFQDLVTTGRKVKSLTNTSLKNKPFIIDFSIGEDRLADFISFLDQNACELDTIRKMLKADKISIDVIFSEDEEYPFYSGEVEKSGIKARLWAKENIWE